VNKRFTFQCERHHVSSEVRMHVNTVFCNLIFPIPLLLQCSQS